MFGLLSGMVGVPGLPAITGPGGAGVIRHSQWQTVLEAAHRERKCNLVVTLPAKSAYSTMFDGSIVVLKNNKLYVNMGTPLLKDAHPFNGYYLSHPQYQSEWETGGMRGQGMVSTIAGDHPPMLNWVYVRADTHEIKYGMRKDGKGHIFGPWDCTDVDRRVTFEGWEGFLAVEEEPGSNLWALYFDRDNDALGGRNIRRLAVQLCRKERLKTKEMADQERRQAAERMAGMEEPESGKM